MAGKKYVGDYILEEYTDAKGKSRTRRIYRGVYYEFRNCPQIIRRLRLTLLTACPVAAALLLPLMFSNTPLGRTVYVVLPGVAALAPLYLLLAAAWRLGDPVSPFTKEHRDKTDHRIRGAGICLPVFLGIACIGCIVHWILDGIAAQEIFSVICLTLAEGISLFLLTQRKKADTVAAERK